MAVMAAPPAAREILFPIFAFNVEVARAPWVTEEPMIAEMRLQWWRDGLGEIAAGGAVRRHEVMTPLAQVVDAKLSETLDKLVQARRWDIYREPFEDAAHFDAYLDQTTAGLLWVAARALGVDAPEGAVRQVGYGAGLANWFLAVPALLGRGRSPLVSDRPDVLSALAQRGLAVLTAGRRSIPAQSRPATRTAWLAPAILKTVIRHPQAVVDSGLQRSGFSKRRALLWRVLLRAA